MNGGADLGGMQGFGAVVPEPDEPPFHAQWERRAFALTLAMGATGAWNLDMSRSARESLPPQIYLSSSYYEIWIAGLERLLVRTGLLTPSEIAHGMAEGPGLPVARVLEADRVAASLARGAPTERSAASAARFEPGDTVLVRLMNPPGHTRCPRYLRGRTGIVEALRGAHVFPDSHAAGSGEEPHWLYTVRFRAADLWGPDTSADEVCADLWEPYLESPR